jgi:hypothetical protein
MFNDIISAYADALYVATTLRPPVSARPGPESDRAESCRAPLPDRLVRRLVRWLRRGAASVPTAAIHTPRG